MWCAKNAADLAFLRSGVAAWTGSSRGKNEARRFLRAVLGGCKYYDYYYYCCCCYYY